MTVLSEKDKFPTPWIIFRSRDIITAGCTNVFTVERPPPEPWDTELSRCFASMLEHSRLQLKL